MGPPMNRRLTILLAIILTVPAIGKTFRIAALYPTTHLGHIKCTCGYEAACITKAAIEEAKKSGLDVSLENFQTDRDSSQAADVAKKVAAGKFDMVVGTLVSAEAIPVSQVLEEAGIPFLTPTATNPEVTRNKKLAMRIPFNDFRQSLLLARLSLNDLRAKRIAIIRNDSTNYSEFLGTQYAKEIKELNPAVPVAEFPIIDGFNDFKGLVDQVLSTNPDLLFVPLAQGHIAALYVELVARNAHLILLGSDTIEGKPEFSEMLGMSQIRFIYPKHWNEKLKGPKAKTYLSLLQKHCGQYSPSMPSAEAYDAIELVLSTLRKNQSARGEQFVQTMKALKFKGVAGPIRYGVDGDPIKPLELFELKGSIAKYWKRYE